MADVEFSSTLLAGLAKNPYAACAYRRHWFYRATSAAGLAEAWLPRSGITAPPRFAADADRECGNRRSCPPRRQPWNKDKPIGAKPRSAGAMSASRPIASDLLRRSGPLAASTHGCALDLARIEPRKHLIGARIDDRSGRSGHLPLAAVRASYPPRSPPRTAETPLYLLHGSESPRALVK